MEAHEISPEERLNQVRTWLEFLNYSIHLYKCNGGYKHGTHTYHEDYLMCMRDADLGDERAVLFRQEFLTWILTK